MLEANAFCAGDEHLSGVDQHLSAKDERMDSIRNDVTRHNGGHSGETLSSLCIACDGELQIEHYAFTCIAPTITATWGRLVSLNSANSGLFVGVCCTTIQSFPSA